MAGSDRVKHVKIADHGVFEISQIARVQSTRAQRRGETAGIMEPGVDARLVDPRCPLEQARPSFQQKDPCRQGAQEQGKTAAVETPANNDEIKIGRPQSEPSSLNAAT